MAVNRATLLLVGFVCVMIHCQFAVASPLNRDASRDLLNALQLRSVVTSRLRATCVLQVNSDLAEDIKAINPVQGTISFDQLSTGGALQVSVRVSGINSDSADLHGFHVHTSSDMSNGCTSTGGHFNPFNKNHGGPSDQERHVGDFGNVNQSAGTVEDDFEDNLASLVADNGGYIIGRSIVLHKNEDDLGKDGHSDSLTTGHAGARLACCEIIAA